MKENVNCQIRVGYVLANKCREISGLLQSSKRRSFASLRMTGAQGLRET